ncbi:MAG: GDP-mannose 4,6-dehydratase [Candidatus Omnitrophica bacterium]|nr:GDP-mannose 4,6-dehydratase [Candidatus Omnitrophota bacterium]
MRCFITGGAGFIGSNLSRELLKRGWKVEVVDNLSTSGMWNIKDLVKNENFKFHKGSIINRTLLRKLIKRCDIVFHLAAGVGVRYILDHPLTSVVTNLQGTENVLEITAKYRKKIIIASTSEVYGKHPLNCQPFKETDDRLMGPTTVSRWGYAEAKAMDEFLALAYSKEKKLPVVIVRFFNVVGPVQVGTYGMVLPRLIGEAMQNKPLTVHGDGRQLRSFTYIDDAVGALIDLSLSEKAEGDIFNIGSNEVISIRDLAKKIKKKIGLKKEIRYITYRKAFGRNAPNFEDMMCRIPDITKIKKVIGYKPKYDIEAIIDNTIAYFRDKGRKGPA